MIGIIESAIGLAGDWLRGKREEKQAKHKQRLRQIDNDANWDNQQASASADSWKDEWLTLLISIPMILAFVPDAVPYVQDGFEVLDEMPEWYKSVVGVVFAAAFGFKKLADVLRSRK